MHAYRAFKHREFEQTTSGGHAVSLSILLFVLFLPGCFVYDGECPDGHIKLSSFAGNVFGYQKPCFSIEIFLSFLANLLTSNLWKLYGYYA